MKYHAIHCTYDKHVQSILDIYNEVIETSTAIYDYENRTMESMKSWFDNKLAHHYPVIGLESEAGILMAFGSYDTFRAPAAYRYSVEHSIYVHHDFRGQGLGHILLERLIQSARDQDFHAMIGYIDADNHGSIALHKKHGFQHVGTLPEVGYKFCRWLNLTFYQLILDTPKQPIDKPLKNSK